MSDNKKHSLKQDTKEEDMSDSFMSRQIVQEILNFGVRQEQMIKIIQILALELEDRDLMLKISNLIEDYLGEGDTSHNTEAKGLIKEI